MEWLVAASEDVPTSRSGGGFLGSSTTREGEVSKETHYIASANREKEKKKDREQRGGDKREGSATGGRGRACAFGTIRSRPPEEGSGEAEKIVTLEILSSNLGKTSHRVPALYAAVSQGCLQKEPGKTRRRKRRLGLQMKK